jgi:hypothetical protein
MEAAIRMAAFITTRPPDLLPSASKLQVGEGERRDAPDNGERLGALIGNSTRWRSMCRG